MKKVLAFLLTLMLCLSCIGAMADEELPLAATAVKYVEIDEEAVLNLYKELGMPEEGEASLSALLGVMNHVGTKVVTTEDGTQGELIIKETPVANYIIGDKDGEIVLSTSLLPNYTLTIAENTIVDLFEALMNESEKELEKFKDVVPEIERAFKGVNFAELNKNYAAYSQEYMADFLSSLTLGQVEEAEYMFEETDTYFNAKQDFEVDLKDALDAGVKLVNKRLQDENIPSLIAAFNKLGIKIILPSEVTVIVDEKEVPKVKGSVYCIVNESGAVSNTKAIVIDTYKEGAEKDADQIKYFVSDEAYYMTLVNPANKTNIVFEAKVIDETSSNIKFTSTSDTIYYAVNTDVVYNDEGIAAITGLYVMNPDSPVMVKTEALTPGGELTLPLYSDEKTVLSIEDILQEEEGKAGALVMVDLLNNGVSGLINNIVKAIPDEITTLLTVK
ncbi:MAG: hypothetical protein IJ719_07585 [Clostridia bacterium]|nr:hypothetical protein [Clostridia bacterium]